MSSIPSEQPLAEIPLAATFPLPFRVLVLAGLGLLGWATNLHGLHAAHVDAPAALDLRAHGRGLVALPPSPHTSPLPIHGHPNGNSHGHPHPPTVYMPLYRLSAGFFAWVFVTWILFRAATQGDYELVDVFKYIPGLALLGVLVILACPWDICRKRERDLFLLALKRCVFASADDQIYFSDVIYADIFTSFAKVIGDVWLSLCMLFPGGSLHVLPELIGWPMWILPTLMALPYAVRLRQCLIEYNSPFNESRRPLYNALKYATSFPVIFLSAAQRLIEVDPAASGNPADVAWYREHKIFRFWLLFAAINSLYSFWWDVTNDWGLDLLRPRLRSERKRASIPRPLVLPSLHASKSSTDSSSSSSSQSSSHKPGQVHLSYQQGHYPYGLRPTLLYPLPVYPLLIFLNLVLRLTWSVKLSSHLHHQAGEGSLVIFALECAEVFRRWMWVFVRVEWEILKKGQGVGLGPGSIGGSRRAGTPGAEEEYELVFAGEED